MDISRKTIKRGVEGTSQVREGTNKPLDTSRESYQENAKQQEVLKKIQEPLKKFFEEHLDHKDKEVLKKGEISGFSRDDNNKLKLEVEIDSPDGKEKRGFSIDLDKLSPEEKNKFENEAKKEFMIKQIGSELKYLKERGVLEESKNISIEYIRNNTEEENGKYVYDGDTWKLHDDQKEELDKVLSSLWRSDEKAPASDVNGNNSREGTRSTVGEQRNIKGVFSKNKDQSEGKKLEDLYKEGDRIKKQGDRISNFMGFMNIANTVSIQATGNLEVLVDRMLQTEGNPNSMQGMYNPSQFIHEAYNRNIDQKLHANRSEINIRKQELRRNNDGKEEEEKIQKQIEEIGNKAEQERHGRNAKQERVGNNAEQEGIGNNANKRKVVNDEGKDKKAEDE